MTVASVSATGDEPARVGSGQSRLRSRLRTLRDDVSRVQSADEVLDLLDRDRLRSADGLADVVGRGSETAVRPGLDRIIEMQSPLRELLPGQGLRRGSTVTVRGSTSLLLEMLGAATMAGCWCAVVGMPDLGFVAAAELGVVLERLAIVREPGPDWPQVVAALLDGIDVVVVAAPAATPAVLARRLAARARQRSAVLVSSGEWPAAELTIEADHGFWCGLSGGRGRLRCRALTVVVRGRGAAERPRRASMWLPALTGPLPMVAGQVAAPAVPPQPGDTDFAATA